MISGFDDGRGFSRVSRHQSYIGEIPDEGDFAV
jgi:hypothetical protein